MAAVAVTTISMHPRRRRPQRFFRSSINGCHHFLLLLLMFVILPLVWRRIHFNDEDHTIDEIRVVPAVVKKQSLAPSLLHPKNITSISNSSRTSRISSTQITVAETAITSAKSFLPMSTEMSIEVASGRFAKLKTLVVVMGTLRGGEAAWKSLYQNVLRFNGGGGNGDTDLALLIGEGRGGEQQSANKNSSLFERAKYYWPVPEFEDWSDAIDTINGTGWRQSVLPILQRHEIFLGGVSWGGFIGSGAIIFMLRYWLSQKIFQLNLLDKYDRFVVTRSDHYYLCPHDWSVLDPLYFWVPEGESYHGITDRHWIVSRQHIIQALDILPHVLQNVELYTSFGLNAIPERILKRRFKYNGLLPLVKKFPRVMFTCAVPGDTTRWKDMEMPTFVEPIGVYLKYPTEYELSQTTCGRSSSLELTDRSNQNSKINNSD